MMATHPPGLQTRSISARPASPPCPSEGVKAEQATTRSAKSSGSGSWSKNPPITRTRSPVVGRRELPPQDPAQRQRGLHRHHALPALDELHRQPSRARADLGDPVKSRGSQPTTSGWSRSALASRS